MTEIESRVIRLEETTKALGDSLQRIESNVNSGFAEARLERTGQFRWIIGIIITTWTALLIAVIASLVTIITTG